MTSTSNPPRIRVGPAGWSYTDWHGIVYPAHRPPGFHEASYLAEYFDTIEINTSFYSPPRPDVVRRWVERVQANPDFKFTAKLWRRFTHDRDAGREDEKTFKQSLEPLGAAGRLGALLLQFPWSFKNAPEEREYLGGVCMQFMEYPLVIEVRHSSWNTPEAYQMLADLGVGFCNIDQPVIGRSLGPSARATSPVGYVRLHGRNYENWFSEEAHPAERYDYLYSLDELEPWAARIRDVAQQADVTYVIANNHFEGKAVANALELKSLLTGQKVPVPETLAGRYPELAQVRAPEPEGSAPRQADFSFDAPRAFDASPAGEAPPRASKQRSQ
ncbi:MAG TPA: DUF72 domain-containing protein [Terriglobia bacterium]|nr:DUF72 domain-containing protein [Terriglobia bacterium]